MNEIVKICKKHGELTITDTYIKHRKSPRKHTFICKACSRIRVKRYLDKNKEIISKQRRERWHPIKEKDRRLRRLYNLSLDSYNNMLKKQKGRCKICNIHEKNLPKKLNVDHNHHTGKIRSLLCSDCNLGMGHFKDSINRLQAAIKYLIEHN